MTDGYYAVGEPQFIGCMPVRQELEVLHIDDLPPTKGWTIGKTVSINGNKYLRLLSKYLKKVGKSSEDELSPEEVGKLYSKCEYK